MWYLKELFHVVMWYLKELFHVVMWYLKELFQFVMWYENFAMFTVPTPPQQRQVAVTV
jgi:hypothetical protein